MAPKMEGEERGLNKEGKGMRLLSCIINIQHSNISDSSIRLHQVTSDRMGQQEHGLNEGATIADKTVTIMLDPDYELPPAALAPPADAPGGAQAALRKAEDAVTSMLAKGFILGKDAVGKAKTLDEKHQLTSTASTKIATLDQKIGLTEKINMGTSAVNSKVKDLDQKYQVSEKTKSALAVAEEKVSTAGSGMRQNGAAGGVGWGGGAEQLTSISMLMFLLLCKTVASQHL
ncbi:Binding partner of ACD11 1 [Bienertia sinuspersici]